LVVSIIEENLKEYSNLKGKLESILQEVKLLNVKKMSSEASLGQGLKKENSVSKKEPPTTQRRKSMFNFFS
jgi:regulator of replication initiation timing